MLKNAIKWNKMQENFKKTQEEGIKGKNKQEKANYAEMN